jgi:DNA-binding response OmpR family regulator
MERWILVLCHERPQLADLRGEWQKKGISVRIVSDVGEAAGELSGNTDYLLVIIFSDGQEYLLSLKIIRGLTKAPVLVVNRQYDSTEKTAAIKAGADEYIKWSDSYLEETVASGLALIRRYTELNQVKRPPSSIISRGDLFINVDYHEVIINLQEMEFPRYEFSLLCLLASSPGRVFTNEQLYREVWGEDYLRDADNGLHSCLNRIRRKLEDAGCTSCRIENIRGVGYRFIQDTI